MGIDELGFIRGHVLHFFSIIGFFSRHAHNQYSITGSVLLELELEHPSHSPVRTDTGLEYASRSTSMLHEPHAQTADPFEFVEIGDMSEIFGAT